MRLASIAAALVLVTAGAAACGSADDPPLGGPYGGTGQPAAPSEGTDPGSTAQGNPSSTSTGTTPTSTTTATTTSPTSTTTSTGTGTSPTSTTTGTATGTTTGTGTGTGTGTSNPPPTAPTWTQIYTNYFASGTAGHCGDSGCHSEGKSAASLYSYLVSQSYISGTSSALSNPNTSCLTWFGGNMPKNGSSSDPQAVTDITAWVAAGATDN